MIDINKNEIIKPPYATSGQANSILDLFRRMTPKKIDSKFISDNRIATPSNAFRSVDFLKWLKIIDKEGNVLEDPSKKLRLVGKEREEFISNLIKEAYKDILERVNLKEAKKDDIINFFINEYSYGGSKALHASRLFLHLCQKYGISISEKLKKANYARDSQSKENSTNKSSRKKIKKEVLKDNGNFSNFKDGVKILIRGPGISFDLPPDKAATSAKELDDILKEQLPSIFKTVKLFLPKKEAAKNNPEDINKS